MQGERDRFAIQGGRRGFRKGKASYPHTAPGKKAPDRWKIAQEIWKILVDNQYSIGTVGLSPAVLVCALCVLWRGVPA